MAYDIQDVGVKASLAESHGAITKVEKDKLHKELYSKITKIDAALLDSLTELNKRLKSDMGLPYGFQEINKFLLKYKDTHPDIYLTESEYKFKKAESDKKNMIEDAKVIVDKKLKKA